ncbi:MAG: DUF2809 domain-containing protein [Longicatena sp.]
MKRKRIYYILLLMFVIFLGLYSRTSYPQPFIFHKYGGDVLYAMMVYIGIAICFPSWNIKKIGFFSIIFCFLIEGSQCLNLNWLVYARTTWLRYLIGQGFIWSDLLCYCVGVMSMVILEKGCLKEKN